MFENINEMNLEIETSKSLSDKEIHIYEQELGVSFGNQFKSFLKEFGCLSVAHLEFYGICGDNKSIPSAIFRTKLERTNVVNFPSNLIVIFDDGGEQIYCVDAEDQIHVCRYNRCEKTEMTFSQFIFHILQSLG